MDSQKFCRHRKVAYRTLLLIVIALLSTLTAGCAIGPAAVDLAVTSAQAEPWPDLDWLKANAVTRAEVYGRLGEPPVTRRNGRLVVYGEAQLTGLQDQTYWFHFLFMEFDAADRLSRFRLSRDHLDSCAWDGICVAMGFESEKIDWRGLFGVDQFLLDRNFVLTAPDEEDVAAKAFRPPADRCALYAYSVERGYKAPSKFLVHIDRDDEGPVQPIESSTYLFWPAAPGEQTIHANFSTPNWYGEPAPDPENRRTFTFECTAGTAMFIRIQLKRGFFGRESMQIENIDPEDGRQAIMARRRVLEDD